MSDVLYSKLRLKVQQSLDGQNAIITSERGNSRVVQMTSPITDIMLAGMEKYRIQAGTTDENVSFGYGEIKKVEALYRSMLKKLPYGFYSGLAVVLNGEIHVLGGYGNNTAHYKWDGSSWVSVSTLPYTFSEGSAVVYNNEIHILGSFNGSKNHYKWNGSSWVSVSTLPYLFYSGSAVVYNNEIHILGSSYNSTYAKYHYKWNGSSWSSVSTLPYEFEYGSVVVYNNEIHILGSGYSTGSYPNYSYPHAKKHYKRSGSSWVSVSTLPYELCFGSAVVYNNEIHILGGRNGNTNHYKRSGSSWTSVSTLPYEYRSGASVIWNDRVSDNLVILGTSNSTNQYNYDAQWDGTSWTVGSD